MNQGVQFIDDTTRLNNLLVEDVNLLKRMNDLQNLSQYLVSRNSFRNSFSFRNSLVTEIMFEIYYFLFLGISII